MVTLCVTRYWQKCQVFIGLELGWYREAFAPSSQWDEGVFYFPVRGTEDHALYLKHWRPEIGD